MPAYVYARVSTNGQDLPIQERALRLAGCDVIRSEKVSVTSWAGGAVFQTLLQFARPGDTLVITRIGRLARGIADLRDMVRLPEDR